MATTSNCIARCSRSHLTKSTARRSGNATSSPSTSGALCAFCSPAARCRGERQTGQARLTLAFSPDVPSSCPALLPVNQFLELSMNRFSRFFLFALLAIALPVMAQDWPKRPVKIIVPYAPGGNTDAIARITAERLGTALGQPVIVENRGGAGGAPAADFVAKSPGGRLHPVCRRPVAVWAGPADTKSQLRPIEGFHAHRQYRRKWFCDRGQSGLAGYRPQELHRLCQGASGKTQLRLRPAPEA